MCGAVDLRSIFVSITALYINGVLLIYIAVDLELVDVRTVDEVFS
jgi:hypothetical protein